MSAEVTEIVPGEYRAVRADGRELRVLVPAGVGLAGVDDVDLVEMVIGIADKRRQQLPAVVDISQLFATDPGLLAALEAAVDEL